LAGLRRALSPLQGGIVWGVSQALFEESRVDPVYGRFANNNYHATGARHRALPITLDKLS
jgi:CO/xanthine dehydrogenase Mo-binding subunit